MKTIWGVALAFAVYSLSTTANAETWSCDLSPGTKMHSVVQYSVSHGRMTSSSSHGQAPGSLRVSLNDDHFLVAFAKLSKVDPNPIMFMIIEKKSGALLSIENVLMTVIGKSYGTDEVPSVEDNGHCTLLER